jgi:hypothetical protein
MSWTETQCDIEVYNGFFYVGLLKFGLVMQMSEVLIVVYGQTKS